MAQKLRDDKIGTISHSGGTISMAASSSNPAWLTIGGQQYRVTSTLSRTISADVTLAQATRYQVFAVISGGNVVLRISTNENSIGPSGFASWKLVGSFLSQGFAAAFGGLLPIDRKPIIRWSAGSTTNVGATSGVITNIAYDVANDTHGQWQNAQGAFNAGTGNYATNNARFRIPFTGRFKVDFQVGWVPNANVANTWSSYIRLNGVTTNYIKSINATGTNSAGLVFLYCDVSIERNYTAGDTIELSSTHDAASGTPTFGTYANISYESEVIIKDL